MTLTQILQKIRSAFYTKTEVDTALSSKADSSDLTTHTSNADIHVTSTDKTTWNGKQGALTTDQLNACNSGITSTKVSAYDTHVANTDVHVTTSDKSTWNAKQNALSTTQLSACNSGITSNKVSQYDGYASTKVNKAGDTMTGDLLGNGSNNLGTSSNKWKTINGINPGALSLPVVSSGINLDLTNFKIDGSNNIFKLTSFLNYPYDNGWMFVKLNGCTRYYADHWYKVVANTFATPSTVSFFIPVNDNYHDIALSCVCTEIEYIKIFPCQGNV